MAVLHTLIWLLIFTVIVNECANVPQKRSFVQLGCMGKHDRSVFAYLDSVCEECFELYREPDLHTLCRSDCFKNDYFSKCVAALLKTNEEEELNNSVQLLRGRRK